MFEARATFFDAAGQTMPLSSARVFDYSNDAAVAKLLADEAKASSTRYATQGLVALLPKRSAGTAPKPNTRFLKNLVRDADQHNSALRRKEDRERVERLRNGGSKHPQDSRGADSRSRSHRDSDHRHDSKRRKVSESQRSEKNGTDTRTLDRSTQRTRHRSQSRSGSPPCSNSEDKESSKQRRNRHDRERSRDPGEQRRNKDAQTSHRTHRRPRSLSRSGSLENTRQPRTSSSPDHKRRSKRRASSSDPLEEIIGPILPKNDKTAQVRYRGRGAHKLASTTNIDDHFSSVYDPTLDVQPDTDRLDDNDDWDMALEALRDRQALQRSAADRLKAAGFKDDEIRKWEDGGQEKDIRDVQWRSKGQTREWDIGKINDEREGRLTP